MGLDFDKEIERILKEKKEKNPKELYEIHRIRKKEDELITMELIKVGFKVSSLFDLINYKTTDIGFINLLIAYLDSDKISDPIIKDGIIRAITVKKAKGLVEEKLLDYYNSLELEKELIGWSIGSWFEFLYSDLYFYQIKKIIENKKNGASRQMFIMALCKTKEYKLEAEKLLLKLTFDAKLFYTP